MGDTPVLLEGWRVYERTMVKRNRAPLPAGLTRPPHEVFIPRACYQICRVTRNQAVITAACALNKNSSYQIFYPVSNSHPVYQYFDTLETENSYQQLTAMMVHTDLPTNGQSRAWKMTGCQWVRSATFWRRLSLQAKAVPYFRLFDQLDKRGTTARSCSSAINLLKGETALFPQKRRIERSIEHFKEPSSCPPSTYSLEGLKGISIPVWRHMRNYSATSFIQRDSVLGPALLKEGGEAVASSQTTVLPKIWSETRMPLESTREDLWHQSDKSFCQGDCVNSCGLAENENFLGLGQNVDIRIELDDEEHRKQEECKTEDGHVYPLSIYYDGETVAGRVLIGMKRGSKLEHQGIRIDFLGVIEFFTDRGNRDEFITLSQDLARPGILSQPVSYPFEFLTVNKPYESYCGTHVRLRYFLRVTVQRRLTDLTKDREILVHSLTKPMEPDESIQMEVGIEDSLHIEFEYNKSKYHLRDVIVGKIYFLLVRVKIKNMEIQILKRETLGSGPNMFTDSETIAKYEIMDGAPVRGESIPIRLFLQSYSLSPTMRDVNRKFSVRYFLNLVLLDEEERRYYKQQVYQAFGTQKQMGIFKVEAYIPSHFRVTRGLGNLAVSQPSCFLLVAWQLGTERVLQLNDPRILYLKNKYLISPPEPAWFCSPSSNANIRRFISPTYSEQEIILYRRPDRRRRPVAQCPSTELNNALEVNDVGSSTPSAKENTVQEPAKEVSDSVVKQQKVTTLIEAGKSFRIDETHTSLQESNKVLYEAITMCLKLANATRALQVHALTSFVTLHCDILGLARNAKHSATWSVSPWIVGNAFSDCMPGSIVSHFVSAKRIPEDGITLVSSTKNVHLLFEDDDDVVCIFQINKVFVRGYLNTGVLKTFQRFSYYLIDNGSKWG
ncbi:vacuolar protein sorting-associated protein 26B [Clonorchis sinensis]|uniref:Vacuolar protein sorting-associated protein 26B n=1 Tax=Clonorchis sinensis TaxID=79923 RepID=G7YC41_CLOSI|nr:vacuolar protein sorting-associated protein 26B [Clonorchis sinensis]